MRKLTEKYSWLQLIFGIVLIALGVITIVLAANGEDNFDKTICIVWSIVLFVIAALIIVFDIVGFTDKPDYAGLIIAGVCVGAGIFVLANQEIIRKVIATLLPYVLISIGGVLLLKTIILAIKRINFTVWILPFVLSVIFIASGIIFLCVSDMLKVIYIVVGVLFIVLGGVEMIGYISIMANKRAREKANLPEKVSKKRKKKEETQPEPEQEAVEAEIKQIEQEEEVKLIE